MKDAKHPVNVLHIASGDLWAGAEVQLHTLACELQRDTDLNLTVIVLNHGELETRLTGAGVRTIVIDEASTSTPGIITRTAGILRQHRIDVVHTHRQKENIIGSIAAFFSGRLPSLRTVHGAPEHNAPAWKIHKHVIRMLDDFCGKYLQNYIIPVSHDLAGILAVRLPTANIRVIENGINLQHLESLRHKHTQQPQHRNRVRIGIAGRLVPVKRVDLFIQAAALLTEQQPGKNMEFHIYGDGPARAGLEQLAVTAGGSSRILFRGHTSDIHTELLQLDALLMTSDHEGTPMVLLEALALGIPVVAHACGGIPAVLDGGNCGILVEDHCPEGYARAVIQLLDEPEEKTSLRNQCIHTHLEQHYSAARNAQHYTELYRQLASTRNQN